MRQEIIHKVIVIQEARNDEIFQGITLDSLKEVTAKTIENLITTGITTCGQMCDLTDNCFDSIDDVSKKKMLNFQEYAQSTVKVSNLSILTDHCKHDNLYN